MAWLEIVFSLVGCFLSGVYGDPVAPFFLLRAEATNIITQKDLLGEPKYQLYDWVKTGSNVDFGINIFRHNVARVVDEVTAFTVKGDKMLRVSKIEYEEGENDLSAIVVTSDSIFVYEPSTYNPDTKRGLQFEWSFANKTFSEYNLTCQGVDQCTILSDSHFTIRDQHLVVVIEFRHCTERVASCSIHLGFFLLSKSHEREGSYDLTKSQVISLNQTEYPGSSLDCRNRGMRAFKVQNYIIDPKIGRNDKTTRAIVVRYCPIAPPRKTALLDLYVLLISNNTFSLDTHRTLLKYSLPSREAEMKVLKVFSVGEYVIIVNSDRLISWHMKSLFSFTSRAEKGNKPSTGITSVFELDSEEIWCNHMNFNELSCLYLESHPTSGAKSRAYKILDLVQIDGNITTIHATGNTIISDFALQRAFNTKHYILIIAKSGQSTTTFICDKRISNIQAVSVIKHEVTTQCPQLALKANYEPESFNNLLFDDNFNNELNGYLLVSLRDLSNAQVLRRIIKPVLLSGHYFEIIPSVDLSSQLCHRYMEYCAQFDLIFKAVINTSNGTKEVQELRSFYILNHNFSSVLPKKSIKDYFSGPAYSNMMLMVDDYFMGDLRDLKISSMHNAHAFSTSTQGTYRAISQSSSGVIMPLNFSVQFPKPNFQYNYVKPFFLEWCQIRLSDNKPVSLSFGLMESKSIRKLRNLWLYRSLPNLELAENNASVSEDYLASKKIYTQEQPPSHFLLTYKNSEFSTLSFIKIKYEDWVDKDKHSHRRLIISMDVFGGKKATADDLHTDAEARFEIKENETVETIRSPLDSGQDLFAIITKMRIIICQIKTDDDGATSLKQKKMLMLTKFKYVEPKTQTGISLNANDILYLENLFILDVNITYRENKSKVDKQGHRIYIFFMNPLLDSYYKLGYIELDPNDKNYFFYYYQAENKAILIFPDKKKIVEYVIEAVKLDIKKFGKAIPPMNVVDLNRYGSYSVLEMSPVNVQDSMLHRRTLAEPTLKGFFILLLKAERDGKLENLVLLAEIKDDPLIFFKSHQIKLMERDCFLTTPSAIYQDSSEVIPVIEMCYASRMINVHLIWIENTVDLSQHYYLSKDQSADSEAIKLNLNFDDVNRVNYEENFLIGRSHRYLIETDIGSNLEISSEFTTVPLKALGLVNSISMECAVGPTEAIIKRNMLPDVNCSQEKFTVRMEAAIRKETVLSSNPYLVHKVKDFKRVPRSVMQPIEGLFAILMNDTFVLFSSTQEQLRPLLWAYLKLSDEDLYECVSIKAFTMAINTMTSYKVHLFCTIGSHLKEVILSFPYKDIDRYNLEGATFLTFTPDNMTLYEVPTRLKNLIMMGNNNIKAVDDLIFVVGKKTLWSYGERLAMDIYKVREPIDNQTQRFVLLNSSITEKTDKWKLIAFKIMRLRHNQTMFVGEKYYQMLKLSLLADNEFIRLVYSRIKYSGDQIVLDQMIYHWEIKTYLPSMVGEFEYLAIHAEVDAQPEAMRDEEGDEWRESSLRHFVYGIADKAIFQYHIGEFADKYSHVKDKRVFMPVKYDFSGICAPESEYSIELSAKYLIATCVPQFSNNIPSYLIVFEKRDVNYTLMDTDGLSTFSPLEVLQLDIELKSSSEGLVKLVVGADGTNRILKASKRNLVNQYLLHGELKLSIRTDPSSWSNRNLTLTFSNQYEQKTTKLLMTTNKFRYIMGYFKFLREDPALVITVGVYLVLMIMILSGVFSYLKSAFSGGSLQDQEIVVTEEKKISKHELAQRILSDPF